MVTISNPLRAGAVHYYIKYYQKLLKAAGTWFGEAVSEFCLRLRVKDEEFRQLFLGFHPRFGHPIVQNAGSPDRQAAWDITFSAPKSVSVLWSLLPRKLRRLIERAHTEAVKDVLNLLQEAGFTRRDKGGKKIEKASLLFALFRDFTSRALDPQLHTHVLLFNAAMREDGTTGTIRTKEVFQMKMALGECYRNSFEKRLSKFVDLVREPNQFAFRVIGVPESLCKAQSKRRNEIKAELDRIGKFDAVSAKEVTLKTRKAAKNASLDVLFDEWKRVGETHGFGQKEALSLFKREHQRTQNHLSERSKDKPREEIHEANEKAKERKKPVEREFASSDRGVSASVAHPLRKFVASNLYHIKQQKITVFVYPSLKFWEPRKKKQITLPSIKLGPKPQRWGYIRKRLFVGKYFELRIQERILFPEASLAGAVLGWRLPALRIHMFDAATRREEAERQRRMRWMLYEPIPERFYRTEDRPNSWDMDRGGAEVERSKREEAQRRNAENPGYVRS